MAVPQVSRLGKQEEGAVVPFFFSTPAPSTIPSVLGLCLALFLCPKCPTPHTFCSSSSQVELLGSDMLQLLPQHAEGRPHHGVQGPALLHQVVHHRRAAVWGVHLVPLLHPWHHVFQRLGDAHRATLEPPHMNFHQQVMWHGNGYYSEQQITKCGSENVKKR